MTEKWKIINGYSNYMISQCGMVKSIRRQSILKPRPTKTGYLRVCFSDKSITTDKYIHRLVAEHFIPNPENKPQINHIDGDKSNNNICNLEWVTPKENTAHAVKCGLVKRGKDDYRSIDVIQMDLEYNIISKFGSMMDAERETGIYSSSISRSCRKNGILAGGYRWMYDNKI